jgi:hypothetical protein
MNVRLVSASSPGALAARSKKTDDLLVCMGKPWFARAGIVVICMPRHITTLVALCARGRNVHELVTEIYAECAEGGPLSAAECIRRCIHDLRPLAAAVGVLIDNTGNQYSVRYGR